MTHKERVISQYSLEYLAANPHILKEAAVCDNLDQMLNEDKKVERKVIPFPVKGEPK